MAARELLLITVIVFSSLIFECDAGRHLCGQNIPVMLSLICGGRTNGKRDKGFSNMYKLSKSRVKRGIVEECCIQICSYEVLSSYCSEEPENDLSQLFDAQNQQSKGRSEENVLPPSTTSRIISTLRTSTTTTPQPPGQSGVIGQSGRPSGWFVVLRLGGIRGRQSFG